MFGTRRRRRRRRSRRPPPANRGCRRRRCSCRSCRRRRVSSSKRTQPWPLNFLLAYWLYSGNSTTNSRPSSSKSMRDRRADERLGGDQLDAEAGAELERLERLGRLLRRDARQLGGVVLVGGAKEKGQEQEQRQTMAATHGVSRGARVGEEYDGGYPPRWRLTRGGRYRLFIADGTPIG